MPLCRRSGELKLAQPESRGARKQPRRTQGGLARRMAGSGERDGKVYARNGVVSPYIISQLEPWMWAGERWVLVLPGRKPRGQAGQGTRRVPAFSLAIVSVPTVNETPNSFHPEVLKPTSLCRRVRVMARRTGQTTAMNGPRSVEVLFSARPGQSTKGAGCHPQHLAATLYAFEGGPARQVQGR
jgi:hypothetical protein